RNEGITIQGISIHCNKNKKSLDNNTGHFMHCNNKYKKRRNNNTGHFMHCNKMKNKKRRNNNTGHFMHCNKTSIKGSVLLQCMKCPVLLFLGFLYFFFLLQCRSR